MNIPEWAQQVLSSFENRTEPYREVEIADALGAVRKGKGDLSEEDWKGFIAELSAFLFLGRRNKDGVWGTYFAPMMSAKKTDGTDFHSPDIKDLDANAVSHWEERARSCRNPVMRARYADVVWDLKRAITAERASPDYTRIAIDSYLEATDKRLYPMEVDGIQRLERGLDLTLSINDSNRRERLVEFMFEFYDKAAQAKFAGTWLFLFDNLYGQRYIAPERESLIIARLVLRCYKRRTPQKGQQGSCRSK